MLSATDTVYPALKPKPSERELSGFFTPTCLNDFLLRMQSWPGANRTFGSRHRSFQTGVHQPSAHHRIEPERRNHRRGECVCAVPASATVGFGRRTQAWALPKSICRGCLTGFYRADPARTRNRGGAGLGLAIVESIARLHGGKAEISTRVGRKTRVTPTFASTAVIEKSGPKETRRLGSSDSGVGQGR